MAEPEKLRVEHLGQDLQGLDQARPWPVEELVSIGEKDAPALRRG